MSNSMNGYNSPVLIVGGGPIGAIAAYEVANRDVDTLLIDKKPRLDFSSTCAGLISLDTWKRLGGETEPIVNGIKGLRVWGPDGPVFSLEFTSERAYVIDRNKLNACLISRAREAGVKIMPSHCMQGKDERGVKVKDLKKGKCLYASPRVIIGADGPWSEVRKSFGLPSPEKILHGIQTVARCDCEEDNFVEVHISNRIAPGFFGWVIPLGDGRSRIGLATQDKVNLKEYLSRLMNRKNAAGNEFSTGPIPIGAVSRAYKDNVIIVGDAAGQVKPTTGGGLYPGSRCGPIAGKIAAHVVRESPPNGEICLEDYDKEWMDEVGRELKREMKLHKIFCGLDDESVSSALRTLDHSKVLNYIAQEGDMDHLYPTAKRLLTKSWFLPKLLRSFPGEVGRRIKRSLLADFGNPLNSGGD